MVRNEFELNMSDGKPIHGYLWRPDEGGETRGIVQIAHGAAEYGKRYEDFAIFLASSGYIVCASDHRGHGYSVRDKADLGFLAESGGWERMAKDLREITLYLKGGYPGLGVVLLGHSMGSFLSRTYAILYGEELSGLILSGTAHNPKPLLLFGRYMAERDVRVGKGRNRNPLLNKMTFLDLNKGVKDAKTPCDWLSRDPVIVGKYIKDELCGFNFTSSAFRDLFGGLLFITDRRNIARTPGELPILLLSGADDPVGGRGKMVAKCYKAYAGAGIKHLGMKLYDGMRHEILNEVGKEEVYEDIRNWLKDIDLKKPQEQSVGLG